MSKKIGFGALLILGLAQAALAQYAPMTMSTSTTPSISSAPFSASASSQPALNLGASVSLDQGPWVLGEILFVSAGKMVSNYTWRDKVRGAPGMLYTKADVLSDVDNLMALDKFVKVEPGLYAIPGSPVPSEYYTIAASSSEVRLVFKVTEKSVATSSAAAASLPVPISGMILTPTAYRGLGAFKGPGLGLDFNGTYYIGRLYGKNSFASAPAKTNYLDQVGLWLITADGKMQVQSEAKYRPAMAVGIEGTFLIRDASQPTPTTAPTASVSVTQKSAQLLTDGYWVMSKQFGPVRSSIGFMEGDMGDMVSQLSSFLSPNSLTFYANEPGNTVHTNSVPFMSVFAIPYKNQPIGFEVMRFNGAELHPTLINMRIGSFIKLNFDLGYLKFDGGYDLLGLINFRWSQFPNM